MSFRLTIDAGIFTENGSGGFMSDCIIIGGQFGICEPQLYQKLYSANEV